MLLGLQHAVVQRQRGLVGALVQQARDAHVLGAVLGILGVGQDVVRQVNALRPRKEQILLVPVLELLLRKERKEEDG